MMNDAQRMLLQYQLNVTLSSIIDGRMVELIKLLAADKTPEMQTEISILKKVYEKFLEAKPLVEKLHQQGRNIRNANSN